MHAGTQLQHSSLQHLYSSTDQMIYPGKRVAVKALLPDNIRGAPPRYTSNTAAAAAGAVPEVTSSARSVGDSGGADAYGRINSIVAENAVVVFSGSSGCCMSHVVKQLLCSLGVHPAVVELDQDARGADIADVLATMLGVGAAGFCGTPGLPAVFIGGKLVGGVDRLMAAHISGSLIPQLKAAGALWL